MCVALAAERQPSCDHKGNQCEDKPRKTNKPSSYLFHTVFDDEALKISLISGISSMEENKLHSGIRQIMWGFLLSKNEITITLSIFKIVPQK